MNKGNILIVEDDFLTATILKKHLTKNDYNVIAIANNANDAIKFVEKGQPDLVLMDIFLKDSIDGIEIANLIRKQIDIPIIYLTADSSEETIARAKITDAFSYLVKPVNAKLLITNVELALRRQHLYHRQILETLKKVNDELEQKVKERTAELEKALEELRNEISHRKQVEEALRKADRLATIGKMSAILSHEIRNPLNSIKINTDILVQTLNLSPTQSRRLQIIQKEVNRLDNLLKEVLFFSRTAELRYSEFNLRLLVDAIYHQIKPTLEEKHINFVNHLPDLTISADSEKLKQVFLNLIINAIDAIGDNGSIKISLLINDFVDIYIEDSGSGIPEPDKLFEPFYTTKTMGTGLGLFISQNIIEQHKGELKLVSSQPGKTIFQIRLPDKINIKQNGEDSHN
ncbi:MAG: ATP-binding protein [Ignavibacteria bacterium]